MNGTLPAVSPRSALLHSLAVPGWGQLLNGRRDKAMFFAAAELLLAGGFVYLNVRSNSGDTTPAERDALKTDQNTVLIYFMLAKVFDIMDAYVDAQFRTFDVSPVTPPELPTE
jgi:hypothetical protein